MDNCDLNAEKEEKKKIVCPTCGYEMNALYFSRSIC
jgi:transposase